VSPSNGIKVLVCSSTFYPPKGGGVISLRAICAGLANKGYEIHTAYVGSEKDVAWKSHPQELSLLMRGMWPRIWEMDRPWRRVVTDLIDSEKPDVVITQQDVAAPTVAACRSRSVPAIILLQGVDVFCLGGFRSGRPWICSYKCVGCRDSGGRLWQYPFFRAEVGALREAFANADAVISNSAFTSNTLEMLWGVHSLIAFPIPKEPKLDQNFGLGQKILFYSPVAHKGVDVAVDLADMMKDEHFIFAGGDADRRVVRRIKNAGNIENLPWVSNTDSLYKQTKVLIMPSMIPEGFGRGLVEAMRRGIPCIASDIGALPETLGSGGDIVKNYHDSREWARTLIKYKDPGYLAEKSKAALKESKRFSGLKTVDQVSDVIKNLVLAHN